MLLEEDTGKNLQSSFSVCEALCTETAPNHMRDR